MTTLKYSRKNYDTYIGLDVDKSSFSLTVRDLKLMKKTRKIPSDPEHLYNYITKNFNARNVVCAYEAGPTGFHLYDYLKARNIPCFVIGPSSVPRAANEYVKNNRIDSTKITDFLMTDNVHPIRVPQDGYRELRHLVKIRENYAALAKIAKQRIKALLLQAYLYPAIKDPAENWSSKYLRELKELQCSFAVRSRLDALLADFDYGRRNLLTIQKALKVFVKEHPEIGQYIAYLKSIPGIGFTVAVTILGKIGDPTGLQNPRELAGFVGLVPWERSTGDTIKRGHITHRGDKILRFMLIEAAWVAIRTDTQLAQVYFRIKKKNHPKVAAKIAITAVARKLTQIIYRVLKDKRNYIQY